MLLRERERERERAGGFVRTSEEVLQIDAAASRLRRIFPMAAQLTQGEDPYALRPDCTDSAPPRFRIKVCVDVCDWRGLDLQSRWLNQLSFVSRGGRGLSSQVRHSFFFPFCFTASCVHSVLSSESWPSHLIQIEVFGFFCLVLSNTCSEVSDFDFS